jgi:hypothetical protein
MWDFIALMMEAVRTSGTSAYSNQTTLCYKPEGSDLITIQSQFSPSPYSSSLWNHLEAELSRIIQKLAACYKYVLCLLQWRAVESDWLDCEWSKSWAWGTMKSGQLAIPACVGIDHRRTGVWLVVWNSGAHSTELDARRICVTKR